MHVKEDRKDGESLWWPVALTFPHKRTANNFDHVKIQSPRGVFDKLDKRNPWKDHTILHINYCSGDAHAGNISHTYCLSADGPCYEYAQKGYANVRSAIDWVKRQMNPALESLILSGSSAGALATQIWADALFQEFSSGGRTYHQGSAIVDSFLGLLPSTLAPALLKERLGVCASGFQSAAIQRVCEGTSPPRDKSQFMVSVLKEAMSNNPRVAFVILNSKVDKVQMFYYTAVALSFHKLSFMSSQQYYRTMNRILAEYAEYPNFASFLVDGRQHTFLELGPRHVYKHLSLYASDLHFEPRGVHRSDFYSVRTSGYTLGGVLLCKWLETLFSDAQSECYGEAVSEAVWDNPHYKSISYCHEGMLHKKLRAGAMP
eukprot:TRINITY_DN18045_c0_g2_i1.p1 TRINITY_DN18045_c0_g2~~TRINITY_DN18045_c0_g2_i1.p1  ORF type:complete len:374 (+),score=24.10 TRINITY_DN18045_c0_g2_i1:167-1288(+)